MAGHLKNILGGVRKKTGHTEGGAGRRSGQERTSDRGTYRLNRTLSGYRHDERQASDRSIAHKKYRIRKARMLYGFTCVLALLAMGYLAHQTSWSLSIQTPSPASAEQTELYQKMLVDYYNSRPTERFRPLLDQETLAAYFLERAPEVKNIRIEQAGILSSSVKLTFRQALAQWVVDGQTYYVDESGVIFSRNYDQSPRLSVQDRSGALISGGQEVAHRRFLIFLGQAVSAFAGQNLTVSEIILPEDTVRQAHFKLEGHSFLVKMSIDRSAEAQAEQAAKSIQYISERGMRPEYIDIRVNQRVFYR